MSSVIPFFRPVSGPATAQRPGGRGRYPAAALAALALLIGPAAAAQAHVHVHPDSTVAGSDAELTFGVPSEAPKASTTALSITLPQDHPFLKVSARVTPGWTVKVVTDPLPTPVEVAGTTLTEAAHTVTWTAKTGEAIPPELYQNFYLSVGPLPEAGEVIFTAKQTYSDGSVVNWDQPAVAGADEPEHPAPSFAITPAADPAPAEAEPSTDVETASTDSFSRRLGGAGLLAGLGAIGLLVARRSPRRTPPRTLAGEQTLDSEQAQDSAKTSDDEKASGGAKTPDGDKTLDLSTAGTGRPSA